MFRYSLAIVAGLCAAGPTAAASWADQMLQELSKDFGSVPRGPTLHHSVSRQYNSVSVEQFANVRVSGSCTTAYAVKTVLQPGGETTSAARMDTTRFTGVKRVAIYVLFDQAHGGEVRLWVRAN